LKKGILKKWWFWLIAIFVIGLILNIADYNGNTGTNINNKEDISNFIRLFQKEIIM
jgi:type II secretory pathway component PulL